MNYLIVGSRFVADRNSVRFAHKTALTISFVERGFERLALVTRRWVFRGVYTWLSCLHPWSLSPGGGLGGYGFWPFFPASSLDYLLFFLYQPAFTWLLNSPLAAVSQGPVHQIPFLFYLGPGSLGLSILRKRHSHTPKFLNSSYVVKWKPII